MAHGCASGAGTNGRVATFAVDEARRAFTLTIEEPGAAPVRIAGDAAGSALAVTSRGKKVSAAEVAERRRELIEYLDSHIERLEEAKIGGPEVGWMKTFRKAYTAPPARPERSAREAPTSRSP